MAESVNVTSAVLAKKMEGFCFESKNFVAESEITVTITLAEYRKLIESDAVSRHEINKATADKYKREEENRMLKEEINTLKAKLYEISNKESEE